jgi:hypothetical protein
MIENDSKFWEEDFIINKIKHFKTKEKINP